ncbi:DUF4352 domain-containing protein [Gordonia sp. HNM0687]|uniref:DUF4352 domain-containing protein n=2 Tax=Gordonia mangrovi TaxID=2665643 RepID=A0A6L7GSJ7_9ACTN|nr:DUF4352 domain-containing protein [Gordonia mangrovi]
MTNTPENGPVNPGEPQHLNAPQGAPQYSQEYPSQQPYAQQPYSQWGYGQPPVPPAQSPKKQRKWPWIVGGIVVIFMVIAALSGGGSDEPADEVSAGAANPVAETPAPPAAEVGADDEGADDAVAAINTPVRDGKFEFVVTEVQQGLQSVGDNPYLAQKAQGQFVIVTMTVTNIGDEAKGFSPSNQKLIDAQERSFESDTSAQIALDSDSNDIAVWDNINPGNAVDVQVIYDMPVDAVPASIELHDSMFSGGVAVSLR